MFLSTTAVAEDMSSMKTFSPELDCDSMKNQKSYYVFLALKPKYVSIIIIG